MSTNLEALSISSLGESVSEISVLSPKHLNRFVQERRVEIHGRRRAGRLANLSRRYHLWHSRCWVQRVRLKSL
jgi:hypothetical protein